MLLLPAVAILERAFAKAVVKMAERRWSYGASTQYQHHSRVSWSKFLSSTVQHRSPWHKRVTVFPSIRTPPHQLRETVDHFECSCFIVCPNLSPLPAPLLDTPFPLCSFSFAPLINFLVRALLSAALCASEVAIFLSCARKDVNRR